MRNFFYALLLFFPIQGWSSETVTLSCDPTPYQNGATIEGQLTLQTNADGQTVANGTLDLTVQRMGSSYQPVVIENLSVAGTVETTSSTDGVLRAVKINGTDTSDDRIQFLSLSLDLRTVNTNSWVRTIDGVQYFARCVVR